MDIVEGCGPTDGYIDTRYGFSIVGTSCFVDRGAGRPELKPSASFQLLSAPFWKLLATSSQQSYKILCSIQCVILCRVAVRKISVLAVYL